MSFSTFFTRMLIRSGIAQVLPGISRWSEGSQKFLHYYSDQVLEAPRDELREASVLIDALPPDTIDLSVGAPRLDRFSASMSHMAPPREGMPPSWGIPELRQVVAQQVSQAQGCEIDPDSEVMITAGAAGALHAVLDTVTNRGDRVVLFDPTSPLFPLALRSRQLRAQWLQSWCEDGRLHFHLEHLARALRKARLLILPPVGTPTGGLLAQEDLEQIIWWANRHDVLLYADESFAGYLYDDERAMPSSFELAQTRLFTAGSVSKSHGLSSTRVGWLTGHRHLIRPCMLTHALRASFVPTVCQQMALHALRMGTEALEPVRLEYQARRDYVYDRLQSMGLHPSRPASGLFFWVPVHRSGVSGRAFADRLLVEKKVHVTRGDLFGPGGADYVRISFAGDEGRLREGLRRLEEHVGAAMQPTA